MWKLIGICNSPANKFPEHKTDRLLSYWNIFTYVELFFFAFENIWWKCIWSWKLDSLLRNAPEQVLPR